MKIHEKEVLGKGRKTWLGVWLLQILLSGLVAGCDSVPTRFVSSLSAEERALAAQLPLHEGTLAQESYRVIGPAEGISCQITLDDGYQVSESNAREELQRASFQMGANAVIEVSCDNMDRGQDARSCFRSVVCRGIAVQKNR